MNARVLIALALVFAVAAVRGEEEVDALANVETIEPAFVEETATAAAGEGEGFPFTLPKKLERSTVEPRYYGESKKTPKQYTSPEYRDPKPVNPKKLRKNRPVLFTSHYFSPLPKKMNGKKLRALKSKKGRKLVPFRHTVQTPTGLKLAQKGYTQAELRDGRLPNKYDIPSENMKKTRAPAPQVSLLEVDTTEEMEADESAEAEESAEVEEHEAVPPPFQLAADEHAAVVVADENEFYNEQFTAPTWADEEATSEEAAAADEEVDTAAVEVDSELAHYNELESFLSEASAATASFVEVDEEADESEEEGEAVESEDEVDAEDETEEESEEEAEAEEESEEEADSEEEESSEDEDERPESQEFSLLEEAGVAVDAEEMELDEMAVNERAAQQIDMDATSDEAAMMADADSDEDSSAAEADSDEEEVADEDEAVEEAAELAETDETTALVESDAEAEGVDSLLAEVDSTVDADSDSASDESVEVEAETGKGTPGAAIMPGQTWEQMQNERLDAMEAAMEAQKAATPKVAATVVASKEELNAQSEDTQTPEYNSEAEQVETVEPEILLQTAQSNLADKLAQLKANRQ